MWPDSAPHYYNSRKSVLCIIFYTVYVKKTGIVKFLPGYMCGAYEVTLAKVTVLNFWQENEKVLGKNALHSCLDLRERERERGGQR